MNEFKGKLKGNISTVKKPTAQEKNTSAHHRRNTEKSSDRNDSVSRNTKSDSSAKFSVLQK